MNTAKIIAMLLVTIGTVLPVGASVVQIQLPFSDNFDTHALGTYTGSVWSFDLAFTPVITNSPTPKDGSASALYSLDQVTLTMTNDLDASNSKVWCSFYTKVTTHATPPSLDNEAAAFYVSTNGDLYANDTNTWVKLAEGISTNSWLGVAVQLDYATSNWNLYLAPTGAAFGATMIKKNGTPLAFNPGYTPVEEGNEELQKIEISGQTYIDNFSVVRTAQSTDESLTNVISGNNVQLRLNDLLSGAGLQYFPNGTGYLHTAFGVALANLMTSGDQVSVYVNGEGWRTFTLGVTMFAPIEETYSTTNTPITMTTGLRFNLAGSGERQPAFLIAYNNLATPSATPVASGWNLLAVPMTTNLAITAGSDNFAGFDPSVGDRIYLRRNGQWVWLRYVTVDGTPKWVRTGTRAATESFPAGSSFWYNRAGGSVNWSF